MEMALSRLIFFKNTSKSLYSTRKESLTSDTTWCSTAQMAEWKDTGIARAMSEQPQHNTPLNKVQEAFTWPMTLSRSICQIMENTRKETRLPTKSSIITLKKWILLSTSSRISIPGWKASQPMSSTPLHSTLTPIAESTTSKYLA